MKENQTELLLNKICDDLIKQNKENMLPDSEIWTEDIE